jgi:CubicO group peptidase (beta-lactamase class C family)
VTDALSTALRRSLPFACFVLLLLAVWLLGDPPPRPQARTNLDELELLADLPTPDPIAAAPQTIEQLREQIAAVLEREGVPGVGIALVDRERVLWAGGVGVADRASGRPVDADTQFRAASITKSFVALAVMRLVEQGRLDLDQPLRELMPEIAFYNDWEDSPVTLAHALEHTTGFDDMRFNEWYGDENGSPRDALAINSRSRVARWRPGTRMSYSNPGFTIAGHAIERATGERWDAYLQREILAPLRMPTARLRRTPEFADRLATGYTRSGEAAVFRPIAHAPAGSLLISPRELGNLVRFWLRRGELEDGRSILTRASLERIERTQTLRYLGTDTNYGLGNYGDVMHPVRGRGHDGGIPGFLSCYRYFPELGVGYVMLLNGTHSTSAYVDIRALLFAYLAHDRKLPAPPSAPPDHEAIAAAVGYYGFANPRSELWGFLEQAMMGLRVRPDPRGIELELLVGGTIEMIPTGNGGFRHPSEGGTSVRLTTNTEGQRILLAGWGYFEQGSYAWARGRLLCLNAALVLIQFAFLWGLGWALVAGFRRALGHALAPGALALHGWPAAASLCFAAMPVLLIAIMQYEAFATANLLTIALFLSSLAFAACSAKAIATAVRANLRPTIPWLARLVPTASSIACFAMAIYLALNHVIGFRIWAW